MKTRTAPWDYQRRPRPLTLDQVERQVRHLEWHMAHPDGPHCQCLTGDNCPVHPGLPSFDLALTNIFKNFQEAAARIHLQSLVPFRSYSLDYAAASVRQRQELLEVERQARAIARGIQRCEISQRMKVQ